LQVDSDGDGVDNGGDLCRDASETANGFEDGDGCPDELPEDLASTLRSYSYAEPEMKATARTGQPSARLRRVLGKLASMMRAYPEIRLEIVWHTHSDGGVAYSMEYDKRSALVVKAYLVEHERISPDRLDARGAGADEPVDTNKSAEGRKHNRRVEFKLQRP
jgi:OOP family OmpA-OmpF porin